MPSLLGEDDPRHSLLGIPGAQVLRIEQPDPDQPEQWKGLADTYNKVSDYMRQQRQKSVDEGYWTGGPFWEGGHPTAKGLLDIGQQWAGAFEGGIKGGMPKWQLNRPNPDTISTRIPTSKRYEGNPHDDDSLIIDQQAMRDAPEAYEKNADLIRNYPGLNIPEGATADEVHEALITHSMDNLRYLYNNVPDVVRERGPQWYDGGRKLADRFASEYDVLPRQVAAATAALSPQMVWDQNVSLAKRLLDIRRDQADTMMTPEMSKLIQAYGLGQKKPARQQLMDDAHTRFGSTKFGDLNDPLDQAIWSRAYDEAHNPRTYNLVTPEGDFGQMALNKSGTERRVGWGSFNDIAKAHAVLNDGSVTNISEQMGGNHKVRNFYNNLVDPSDPRHVTIDTHAIAAAHLMPLGGSHPLVEAGLGLTGAASNATGARGLYGNYATAYRRLADELGILPRQLQSVTWEGTRGLFTDVQKHDKGLVKDVENIWDRHKAGEFDADAARRAISERAGGIDIPAWATSGP